MSSKFRNYSKMLLVGFLIALGQLCVCQKHFEEVYSWRTIDYEFPSDLKRKEAIESRAFVQGNSLISSIETWNGKLFMSVPRFKKGIPSTLNYITVTDYETKSPFLKPYPTWEMNDYLNKTKNKKMVSIVSVRVDQCNRLWALDTGILDDFGAKKFETPPAIFVYNLNDDSLLKRYAFKEEDYKYDSKLKNIIVDVKSGNCGNAFAYVADAVHGLIVYDLEGNKSYLINHNYFSFEPIWGIVKIQNKNIQLNDGLQGMALSSVDKGGYRDLLFHSLIGVNQYSVLTAILQNKTLAKENITNFYFLGRRGDNMQSSASIMDYENGVLFYATFVKNGIACWNSYKGEEFSSKEHGLVDEFSYHPMSYPADLKIDSNGTLWVLLNHLLDYTYGKHENKILYSIYTAKPRQIIKGTVCEPL